jgi:hypothetical protein
LNQAEVVSHAVATSYAWGKGDLISIVFAVAVLVIFTAIRKKHRTGQGVTVLLAAGLSLGPLLLILLDPIVQVTGLSNGPIAESLGLKGRSLLELVVGEGRTTLWWAAAVAAVYVIRDLL